MTDAGRPGERDYRPGEWEACLLAGQAWRGDHGESPYPTANERMKRAIAAAYPVIAAAVREQIAAEIEREAAYARSAHLPERAAIMGTAARIARGAP